MRLCRFLAVAMLALALAAASSSPPERAAAVAGAPIHVRFLFDLGDGDYRWSNATVPDPNAVNATWTATLGAAARVGLWVSFTWYSFGGSGSVFILDVGNRSPPGGVGLYVWNATAGGWVASAMGISDLVLRDGDAVALYDAGFNPRPPYAYQYPAPTPSLPYPVLEFRGDNRNTGVSPSPAPDSVGVRWDRDLHLTEIASTPAVAYGGVYVLTLDGLFALGEGSGNVLWSNTKIAGLSSPAVFNGTLILGGSDGRVHAVDAASGHERWNTTLVANPGPSGITSSPKIDFNTVYVGTFNESGGPGEVVSLDVTTGAVLWRHRAPGSVSFSSPAVAGDRLYVGIIGKYNTTTGITYDPPYGVLALNATTGTQVWFHATDGSVAASPAWDGPDLLVPSKDGRIACLNATDGRVVWSASVQAGISSPAVHGATVYVGGGGFGGPGRLTALDRSTGTVRWAFTPNGPVQSSVTYADGKVYFSTNAANGTIYAVDAESGEVVWAYTPNPPQYILGSPVAADGTVFAPSDNGHVYAFDAPPALLNLSVAAPSVAPLDGNVSLTVTIRNVGGAARNVTLGFAITDLRVLASAPTIDRTSDTGGIRTVFWDFGTIGFGETRSIELHVQGVCASIYQTPCPGSAFPQWLTLLSANRTGVAQQPVDLRFNVTITGTATAPSDLALPLAVSAAALVGVAVLALFLLRRRPRGP